MYSARLYLRDGLINVQQYGMASGLFWLRSYISKGYTPPVDMVSELDYDFFLEDLRSHFGYSPEVHVLVWDARNCINRLDYEYAIRNRNGWLAALIAMQNREAVAGHGLTCHFFIVTKSEFELHRKLPSLQLNEREREPQNEEGNYSVEEIQRKRKKGSG
ncbi:hypothetical protein HAV15_011773 [Penicillium sp. str. |nr:hypothetical protein HAV15_011773 [Penicillium sp. str. \